MLVWVMLLSNSVVHIDISNAIAELPPKSKNGTETTRKTGDMGPDGRLPLPSVYQRGILPFDLYQSNPIAKKRELYSFCACGWNRAAGYK